MERAATVPPKSAISRRSGPPDEKTDSSASATSPQSILPADETVYVPNRIVLPLVTAELLDFEPTYSKATIISRDTELQGHVFYKISMDYGTHTVTKAVPLSEILEYVSPLHLERFETAQSRREAAARDHELRQQLRRRRMPKSQRETSIPAMTLVASTTEPVPRLRVRSTPGAAMLNASAAGTQDIWLNSDSEPTEEVALQRKRKRRRRNESRFEVEAILADAMVDVGKKAKAHYLVKWVGWPSSSNTWEPVENLGGAEELLQEYVAGGKSSVMAEGRRLQDRGHVPLTSRSKSVLSTSRSMSAT